MIRRLMCLWLLLMLVGCQSGGPTVAPAPTPTPGGRPSRAAVSEGTPRPTANRPTLPTVVAAATRAAVPATSETLEATAEWFFAAYRANRSVEALAALTPDYSDQVRLAGGLRPLVGVAPDDIQAVKLRAGPGATPDVGIVEATVSQPDGEVILSLTMKKTGPGWRISRIETTG